MAAGHVGRVGLVIVDVNSQDEVLSNTDDNIIQGKFTIGTHTDAYVLTLEHGR